MKRAYTTIVIPALTFGCHVFGDKCLQETIKKFLNQLNRLASLLIANVAPSSPTKGLEVIYNLIPLDILIEKRATEIMARIDNQIQPTWDGFGKIKKKILSLDGEDQLLKYATILSKLIKCQHQL